jgi:ubiquinone/menaquinone biosynthesis C-methylase UbiE
MEALRKPFQGLFNIIRFNWHFYALSLGFALLLIFSIEFLNPPYQIFALAFLIGVFVTTLVSLVVSFYVYDLSRLYELDWLEDADDSKKLKMVNINAGFDETSALLKSKFRNCELLVFDFYNPSKHTEVSIKRARKAYPPYPGTKSVKTDHLPLEDHYIDKVFAILSAHEIRDETERDLFFKELHRILKPSGQIIVTEHLRDPANFLAYNIGFLHFHSKASWFRTFSESGLLLRKELKITPFISTFILEKNGTSS